MNILSPRGLLSPEATKVTFPTWLLLIDIDDSKEEIVAFFNSDPEIRELVDVIQIRNP